MEQMHALETYPPRPDTSLDASDEEEYSHAQEIRGSDGRSLVSLAQIIVKSMQGRSTALQGTLSKSEWEVVSMYLVFAFRKKRICPTEGRLNGSEQ